MKIKQLPKLERVNDGEVIVNCELTDDLNSLFIERENHSVFIGEFKNYTATGIINTLHFQNKTVYTFSAKKK